MLLDYVEQVLPFKVDEDGQIESLRKDFFFQDTNKYFYIGSSETAYKNNIRENKNLINDVIIYKQIDVFTFSANFIDKFIKIMYLQLIYDVLGNRAMNEHILQL